MTHVAHELHEEFPGSADRLHELKLSDPHFARQAERYHELNREIHRIESEVAPASDQHLEELKKQRLALLDEIAQLLASGNRSSPLL
jgi:uncharacterized protein YdcH (DUF465 family)